MSLVSLINELKATTKKSEKVKILKTATKLEREFLRVAISPNILTHLSNYKYSPVNSPLFSGDTEENLITRFIDVVTALHAMEFTGNSKKIVVDSLMTDTPADLREIFVEAINKDLRIGCTYKSLNKAYGDNFIEVFEVQLANKYDPAKNYKGVTRWLASSKLDGLRCYYLSAERKMFTRKGKEIHGFDEMKKELGQLCDTYSLTFMDGELYSHDIKFEAIQGIVMRRKTIDTAEKNSIFFNCFAVGPFKKTDEMLSILRDMSKQSVQYIKVLEQEWVDNNPEAIDKVTDKFLAEGYEGAMLRHPENAYHYGRNNDLVKVKKFKEEDLVVQKVETGPFNMREDGREFSEETVTNIIVSGMVEGVFVDGLSVGSGFSREQRREMFTNPEEYIGRKAEIKYQNMTKDGMLRFPVFMKWKMDR